MCGGVLKWLYVAVTQAWGACWHVRRGQTAPPPLCVPPHGEAHTPSAKKEVHACLCLPGLHMRVTHTHACLSTEAPHTHVAHVQRPGSACTHACHRQAINTGARTHTYTYGLATHTGTHCSTDHGARPPGQPLPAQPPCAPAAAATPAGCAPHARVPAGDASGVEGAMGAAGARVRARACTCISGAGRQAAALEVQCSCQALSPLGGAPVLTP